MSIVVVTPPASEPVSLAEAKLFLRVDHAHEDDLIASMIAAGRDAVEAGCGRALLLRRVREKLDLWRQGAAGGAWLRLAPVAGVVALRVLAPNGAQSVVEPGRYRLEFARERPRLVFEPGFAATLRSAGELELEYEAGMAAEPSALPSALRLATLQIVASLYEARLGAGVPEAARALLRPFATARL